jgi:hypothetical protein
MSDEKHKLCFVCEKRIDNLKRDNVTVVKLKYIKQVNKRKEFFDFFNKHEKNMNLDEYVCKNHINKLNKKYKTSYFHEEPENFNNENQENILITTNENPVFDEIHEAPTINNFNQLYTTNNNSNVISTDSSSNVIHHHHHHHHHHYHTDRFSEFNSSSSQSDEKFNDNDDINNDNEDDDDDDDETDEYDEEEDDEDEDQEVFVLKNDEIEPETLTLEVSSAASSHSRCFVCKNYAYRDGSPFKVISNDGIIDVYLKTKIFVTFGSRCCAVHLTDGGFLKEEFFSQIEVYKEEKTFDKFQMECFFKSVSSSHKKTNSIFAKFGDMENLDPELCASITTLTKD